MTLEAMVGEHISTVAERAVKAVREGAGSVTFDFNEIKLTVTAGMSASDVCANYSRASKMRHDAYVSTPEYKDRERQRAIEAKAAAEAASIKRGRIYATAPGSLTLCDADGWAKAREANADPYGGAVIKFAERWARLMEGAIAQGASVAGCAQEMCSLADEDGITGFMYGCAVGILARVWIHGEELRRWHNKDVQVGNEGDRANETGGVLNPALMSLG